MKKKSDNHLIKLHSIGNQWNVHLEVIQKVEHLSEKQMSEEIFNIFNKLKSILDKNGIIYDNLKSALIPPDAKEKFDFCFIFDTSKVNGLWYSRPIFKTFFDTVTNEAFKDSKNSIFSGDLLYGQIGFYESMKNIENQLSISLNPRHATYFAIFMSNLTLHQKSIINDEYKTKSFYVGAVDWTLRNDYLKRSLMLPSVTLKFKNKLLLPSVEEGYKSMLECIMPDKFKKIYIDEYLYNTFLSYNYHSFVYPMNKDYALNILNKIYATPISNYELIVEESKFRDYIKIKKSHVIKNLKPENIEYINMTLEEFTFLVKQSLSNNIFNIEINQYCTKFNTILDTKSKRIFFSFEYNKKQQKIRLITAY